MIKIGAFYAEHQKDAAEEIRPITKRVWLYKVIQVTDRVVVAEAHKANGSTTVAHKAPNRPPIKRIPVDKFKTDYTLST